MIQTNSVDTTPTEQNPFTGRVAVQTNAAILRPNSRRYNVCEPQIPFAYVIFKDVIQINRLNSNRLKVNPFTGRLLIEQIPQ